jgi:hypothetical protein
LDASEVALNWLGSDPYNSVVILLLMEMTIPKVSCFQGNPPSLAISIILLFVKFVGDTVFSVIGICWYGVGVVGLCVIGV